MMNMRWFNRRSHDISPEIARETPRLGSGYDFYREIKSIRLILEIINRIETTRNQNSKSGFIDEPEFAELPLDTAP